MENEVPADQQTYVQNIVERLMLCRDPEGGHTRYNGSSAEECFTLAGRRFCAAGKELTIKRIIALFLLGYDFVSSIAFSDNTRISVLGIKPRRLSKGFKVNPCKRMETTTTTKVTVTISS